MPTHKLPTNLSHNNTIYYNKTNHIIKSSPIHATKSIKQQHQNNNHTKYTHICNISHLYKTTIYYNTMHSYAMQHKYTHTHTYIYTYSYVKQHKLTILTVCYIYQATATIYNHHSPPQCERIQYQPQNTEQRTPHPTTRNTI